MELSVVLSRTEAEVQTLLLSLVIESLLATSYRYLTRLVHSVYATATQGEPDTKIYLVGALNLEHG